MTARVSNNQMSQRGGASGSSIFEVSGVRQACRNVNICPTAESKQVTLCKPNLVSKGEAGLPARRPASFILLAFRRTFDGLNDGRFRPALSFLHRDKLSR